MGGAYTDNGQAVAQPSHTCHQGCTLPWPHTIPYHSISCPQMPIGVHFNMYTSSTGQCIGVTRGELYSGHTPYHSIPCLQIPIGVHFNMYSSTVYSLLGSALVSPGVHFILAQPRPSPPSQAHPSVPNVTSSPLHMSLEYIGLSSFQGPMMKMNCWTSGSPGCQIFFCKKLGAGPLAGGTIPVIANRCPELLPPAHSSVPQPHYPIITQPTATLRSINISTVCT